ncbi:MAG TPA: Crp/Fnr family transcriptional regulator [Gemmatimonadales bacterium]|nr:Crp/Fnr family transcriptional regulator [Gemmatimonadales bacterium]
MIDPALLRTFPPFARVAPEALAILARGALERRYAPEEVLYTAGSPARGLLLVVAGRVRVVRGRDGRQHLVHDEGPGGALGEVPVFDGGSYPATAIAAEATRCVLLDEAALRAAVRVDPEVAFVFLRRLAARTRHLVDRVDRLAAQDVRGRLARLLLERHREAGAGADAGADAGFALGRTQLEVAEELGTVREVLVRALRELRAAGLVESAGRGRYRVRDARALAALAD